MTAIVSILLVEDNDITANIYQKLLEDAGYNVLLAPDAQTANQTLVGIEVDLIILDFHLPDATGLEWLQTLRTRPNCAELPVILVSQVEHQLDVRHDRFVWFMEKPRQPQHIVTAVETIIAQFDT